MISLTRPCHPCISHVPTPPRLSPSSSTPTLSPQTLRPCIQLSRQLWPPRSRPSPSSNAKKTSSALLPSSFPSLSNTSSYTPRRMLTSSKQLRLHPYLMPTWTLPWTTDSNSRRQSSMETITPLRLYQPHNQKTGQKSLHALDRGYPTWSTGCHRGTWRHCKGIRWSRSTTRRGSG